VQRLVVNTPLRRSKAMNPHKSGDCSFTVAGSRLWNNIPLQSPVTPFWTYSLGSFAIGSNWCEKLYVKKTRYLWRQLVQSQTWNLKHTHQYQGQDHIRPLLFDLQNLLRDTPTKTESKSDRHFSSCRKFTKLYSSQCRWGRGETENFK